MNVTQNESGAQDERLKQISAANRILNDAFETMPQALCVFDNEQRLSFANKRYAYMYRIPYEDLSPGTTLQEIVQLRLKNGIFAGESPDAYVAERAQWGTKRSRAEDIHELSDGRTIAIKRRHLPDGGWLATHTDISNQLTLKRDLQDSTEKYKQLLETMNVVPWEYDCRTGRFLYIGPQAAQFGYPIDDWYGEDFWAKTIHPDDRNEAVAFCQATTEKCEDHEFEYRFVKADGSICWVRDIVSVVSDNGKPSVLRGIFVDITDLKEAENGLRRSQSRFKDIAETASDWFWETDETHRFTFVSKRFTDITGVDRSWILGKTRFEFAKRAGVALEDHQADLDARRAFKDFQYKVANEHGDTCYWTISGRPVFDDDGRFLGYRGSGRDRTIEESAQQEVLQSRNLLQEEVERATTGLRAKTQQLEEALAKEQELVAIQRQFIAMASHEFRTPLAVIDGSVQRLLRQKEQMTPDKLEARAMSIRRAVATMTSLMESTLTAARMDAGKVDIEIQKFDLREAITEVCDRQRELSEKHTIFCDIGDVPDFVSGDRAALELVFSNLLTNAVKYSPHAPDITVRGSCDDENLVIAVHDNGVGIDEDDLPKMFNRFFRAKTSTGIAGTGIGLNLAKAVVELHGGSIAVESQKGQGSIFTVCIPIAGPPDREEAETVAA